MTANTTLLEIDVTVMFLGASATPIPLGMNATTTLLEITVITIPLGITVAISSLHQINQQRQNITTIRKTTLEMDVITLYLQV